MRQMNLGIKLAAGFTALLVLTAIVGWAGYAFMRGMAARSEQMYSQRLEASCRGVG